MDDFTFNIGAGPLRSVLDRACKATGESLNALTVLSTDLDPYRLDTRAGHRDGAWLAEQIDNLFDQNKRPHWRGVHYAIVQEGNIRKPDGAIFRNTDNDWCWLTEQAGKCARWLRYMPFDRIRDARNSPPIIHRVNQVVPEAVLSIGLDVTLPDADDIDPLPVARGFVARQAYHFTIFGEKTSLEDVLLPIAQRRQADLYLPTGEISDTLVYLIAADTVADGRPLVLFAFSDCDPSGWQMPVSIGRKLQAFKDLYFPGLEFEVVPVALMPNHVREFGLPSTPMKDTEKRADRWFKAFGIEQTEIDAMTIPARAGELERIADAAFKPYWDRSLERRVDEAKKAWYAAAREVVEARIDSDLLTNIREKAAAKFETMRAEIDAINSQLELASSAHFDLPPIVVPEPKVTLLPKRPALVRFEHDWIEASRVMRAHKAYGRDD